jgi:hypothetical protein
VLDASVDSSHSTNPNLKPNLSSQMAAVRLLVVGGNGFVGERDTLGRSALENKVLNVVPGSSICKRAVSRGWEVHSLSRSGKAWTTPKGHSPAWTQKVLLVLHALLSFVVSRLLMIIGQLACWFCFRLVVAFPSFVFSHRCRAYAWSAPRNGLQIWRPSEPSRRHLGSPSVKSSRRTAGSVRANKPRFR